MRLLVPPSLHPVMVELERGGGGVSNVSWRAFTVFWYRAAVFDGVYVAP